MTDCCESSFQWPTDPSVLGTFIVVPRCSLRGMLLCSIPSPHPRVNELLHWPERLCGCDFCSTQRTFTREFAAFVVCPDVVGDLEDDS